MQKIYVLLRNDQQTGPYSLEEIIQFDLKPYDLIWIQGGSAGWYYPQEIAALHPYLSFLPKKQTSVAEAKPPFVAMPSSSYTAESPAVAASYSSPVPEEPVYKAPAAVAPAALEEAVFAQFQKAPEKETPAATHQTTVAAKKKGVNPVVVGITTVLIVGGVFAASWMFNRGNKAATQTRSEVVSNFPVEEEIQEEEKQTAAVSPSASTPQQPRSRKATSAAATNTKSDTKLERETATVASEPSLEIEEEPATPPDGPPATIRTENEAEAKTGASETAAPQEKKKKLRDKIFDIFRKKPEETKQEEAGPAASAPGERSASRRDESANLAQMVHVRFTVPNEWMMGIHGAKATLVNRSSETVQKAIVEVQYFDDDNQLLQKKTISFEKVGGKDSKTISIPDHPTATKVDYSVISASGKPAA
jgi:flagellar basal body-associated protein FliL